MRHLDWGRPEGEDLIAGALGVAVHVDEDVDAVLVDPVGGLPVAGDLREVDEVLGLVHQLLPEVRPVVNRDGVAKDLDPRPVVHSGYGLHQVARGVVAEVRGDVSDAEASARHLEDLPVWVDEGRVSEHGHLLRTELGMLGGDGQPRLVFQGIEHGVVGMHRGQSLLAQLIVHDGHQPLHPAMPGSVYQRDDRLPVVIVRPVTDNLEAVCQIAEGIGEVGLQFQGRRIGADRVGNIPRILK